MKPNEFDDLIRQKFDQNDFEYNPRNWDRLADQLDGPSKKRSMMMWWLMPVAGVAASLALAMGVPSMFRHSEGVGQGPATEIARKGNIRQVQPVKDAPATTVEIAVTHNTSNTKTVKRTNKNIAQPKEAEEKEEKFAINYFNATRTVPVAKQKTNIDLLNSQPVAVTKEKEKDKDKKVAVNDVMGTFAPEVAKKKPTLSINIDGGYSMGSRNSGYSAGASIRKMVSEKVYIEGNVAFANNNIAQDVMYQEEYVISKAGGASTGNAGAKTTSTSETAGKPNHEISDLGDAQQKHVTYSLSYIQVQPSIGYKIMKRLSVGMGPDFQQVLADNRPGNELYQGQNKQAPMFDVGFIGRTEFSVTRNVKAGVAYRKGINNVLTPMNKFIDRDYMQFQVRCAIFNK